MSGARRVNEMARDGDAGMRADDSRWQVRQPPAWARDENIARPTATGY